MSSRPDSAPIDWTRRIRGILILVGVYLAVVFLIPKPAAVSPDGWRLTGIFIATIAGSILQSLPGGALVLMAVTLSIVVAGVKPAKALAGYGDSTVWLVQAAFFISRALINTGLARRIALFFVRLFGKSSLGVSYALSISDMLLAIIIPSNGARSGGITLPIVRSISELYGSSPGATAGRLGSFLFSAVYQGVCIGSAMFITGQASNVLAAQLAEGAAKTAGYANFHVTPLSWMLAGIVPGLVSILVVPWVVSRVNPPEITRTPEASEFARQQLVEMGPLSRSEWILLTVFVCVCVGWMTTSIHGLDVVVPALMGAVTLLLLGVLTWNDVIKEESAWDIFIWYGGLLQLAKNLSDTGVTTEFAKAIAASMSNTSWFALFSVALLIYFYAHYAFASITAHLLSMYPAFVAVLLVKGAPVGLVCYAFACFANLSAGLTNYGTTPAPMFFSQGYVPFKTWWRVGFVASLVNVTVWTVIGFSWWKLIGYW